MSVASWEGAKICWFQRSYESPALLVLLKLLFSSQPLPSLRPLCREPAHYEQLLAYAGTVFQNCGNFLSFGDTKFVPELPAEDFLHILRQSECYKTHAPVVEDIWPKIEKEVYCSEDPFRQLGFRDNNGTTSYYSGDLTSTDAKRVDDLLTTLGISPLNTRLFKLGEHEFELRIASAEASTEKMPYLKTHESEGLKVHVKAGDFKEFMAKTVQAFEQSQHYVANET